MKKIILLAVACFAGLGSFSQSFMHGAGVVIFVDKAANTDANIIGGLTYSPRFNFMEQENLSLSIGVPLSVGLSGSYNSRSDNGYYSEQNTLKFMFDAPLILNLNFGCGSSKANESRFGFFVGGGFGYHYGTMNETLKDGSGYDYTIATTGSTSGPVGNLGVRIGVGKNARRNIEIKTSYMKGMNNNKPSIFSLGTLFNF
ncbi:hypothetical protein CLV51_1011246 [Chitinophaga niastensis]|uniref:Outer membrane protein with beta-barrel domain n=1 Tax=Chitinophaga niastensis TaxID=536980 RepID=A0A2P8HUK1_CHINA|nr:hypothetical protein [Chitinophaga niastensis]PSL49906.1 hypothetical protein CLV51_1011246 [Chitinophaga niastensis]